MTSIVGLCEHALDDAIEVIDTLAERVDPEDFTDFLQELRADIDIRLESGIDESSYAIRADKNGVQAEAQFRGEAVKAWCAIAVQWFKETGGKSYVTMDLTDDDGARYTMTMQKAGGKTPADRIKELESQLAGSAEAPQS